MSKKIYVGNLPYSATDESLNEAFARHGAVTSARIIMDRDTGRSKGFGFVEMAEESDTNNAIQQLNGSSMDGRELNVSEAKPQVPRESRGGGSHW